MNISDLDTLDLRICSVRMISNDETHAAPENRECLALLIKLETFNGKKAGISPAFSTIESIYGKDIAQLVLDNITGINVINAEIEAITARLETVPKRELASITLDIERVNAETAETAAHLSHVLKLDGDDWIKEYCEWNHVDNNIYKRFHKLGDLRVALDSEYKLIQALSKSRDSIESDHK